jgi:hypothetical protein
LSSVVPGADGTLIILGEKGAQIQDLKVFDTAG